MSNNTPINKNQKITFLKESVFEDFSENGKQIPIKSKSNQIKTKKKIMQNNSQIIFHRTNQ